MDKKSLIGILLIAVVFIGYLLISNYFKKKDVENNKNIKTTNIVSDTISNKEATLDTTKNIAENQEITNPIINNNEDSLNNLKKFEDYGIFRDTIEKIEDFFVVENNKLKITFTNKGGKIYSVEVKDYKTFDNLPLVLFTNNENSLFGIEFNANGKPIITNDLIFTTDVKSKNIVVEDTTIISMKLKMNNLQYLEYQYIISPDDYMIDFNINFVGLEKELQNNAYVTMNWNAEIPGLEKGKKWESDNTTIFLRMADGDIENLGERKDKDDFTSAGNMQWIAYKQQFFSSILIVKNYLSSPSVTLEKVNDDNSKILKKFNSEFTFNLEHKKEESQQFSYYFGPNSFSVLKKYEDAKGDDLDLEKIVPLGWGIFGWVNRFLIIPIFNWLGSFINNYGLIIFLLTLIIKIILFPFTYKSYMSSAKMKVLKPQIDELTKKYPPEKKAEAQQATMALYKKAGVNPMGGCLPMLLQFPILIAMFRFFPASIELRQQSFLWATDLSSYDSIFEWTTNIPLITSFYGNHISLFTLLMAVSMIISTIMTQSNQPSNQSMPGMKMMTYLMPVMMIIWFNNYSAGLSYYYLLANIITILQTLIIRKFFVKEKDILAQMEKNKLKVKPKSKWQQKMDELMKTQQQQKKK
ncbi:MAG: membrane protein insertase YidC [Bacteroidales bacterium]|jgi:YidC/Oxa1 family membrane protein insertase|nr:membrane protein insertase YidC [Bacteroidales bacterium]